MKERISKLASLIDDYCLYLKRQCTASNSQHTSTEKASFSDSGSIRVPPTCVTVCPRLKS